MIEKNEQELKNEKDCWQEINNILDKYNCSLVGWADCYDSEYDNDYQVRADEYNVESKDFDFRLQEFKQREKEKSIEEYKMLCRDNYEELLEKYSKYKDLKPYKVGQHYFWFEGLKFNRKKIKKGLFNWNPNKFWILHNYDYLNHGVSLKYDDFGDWGGSQGKPHFHCFNWHKFSDERVTNCEWFEWKENVDYEAYQDMINICKIIDDLIELEVLLLQTD